jgi:hypothetical protein
MNHKKTLTIAAAALSGLLVGSAARAATTATSTSNQLTNIAGQHAIGLDAPTPHDCKGQNTCKGTGGCKAGDNGCKGQNSCKGKGGCSTNKS